MTTPDIILVVGVMTTSAVSIINAIGLYWGKKEIRRKLNNANIRLLRAEDHRYQIGRDVNKHLEEASQKLEKVQENTNGNLTKLLDRVEKIEKGMTLAMALPDPEDKNKAIADAMIKDK